MPALGLARRRVRQVVDLRAVDLAAVGEEEQVVVRRAHEEVLDVVLVLHAHAGHADAAAALLPVGGERERLDVAGLVIVMTICWSAIRSSMSRSSSA